MTAPAVDFAKTREAASGAASAQPQENERVTHDATDLRNAERLIERHGANLRYIATWGKWLAWDGRR